MLYKYVGAPTESETLRLMRCFCEQFTLKVSEPTSFNDPFEFKFDIDLEPDGDTIRERYFQYNTRASEADYESWRRHLSKWSVQQETREALLARFGVFCASAVEDSLLMWSHYAANHTGFCVGFDESQLASLKGLHMHRFVEYCEEAPLFRYYADPPEQFGPRALCCKSKAWEYEREYRFIFDHRGLLEFPRAALKEIVIGCRAFWSLRNYVRARLDKQDGVRFFQMVEDFGAYRLVKTDVEKNVWPMSSFF